MPSLNCCNSKHVQNGFSLVEIAIVLLVVAIVSGGAIAAFRAQISYTRYAQAREQLREAREAIVNYAIANQVLPCPGTTSDPSASLYGIANSNTYCDTEYKGFLPWKTLGLSATDPWGRPLRYAVSAGFESPNKISFFTAGALDVWVGGTNIDASTPKTIAFSVWSVGEDAINASATSISSTSSSSSASSTILKNTVIAEAAGSDDVVEWVSRYVLFGKMMAAGRTLSTSSSSSASSNAAASSASSAAASASGT